MILSRPLIPDKSDMSLICTYCDEPHPSSPSPTRPWPRALCAGGWRSAWPVCDESHPNNIRTISSMWPCRRRLTCTSVDLLGEKDKEGVGEMKSHSQQSFNETSASLIDCWSFEAVEILVLSDWAALNFDRKHDKKCVDLYVHDTAPRGGAPRHFHHIALMITPALSPPPSRCRWLILTVTDDTERPRRIPACYCSTQRCRETTPPMTLQYVETLQQIRTCFCRRDPLNRHH